MRADLVALAPTKVVNRLGEGKKVNKRTDFKSTHTQRQCKYPRSPACILRETSRQKALRVSVTSVTDGWVELTYYPATSSDETRRFSRSLGQGAGWEGNEIVISGWCVGFKSKSLPTTIVEDRDSDPS